MIGQAIGWGGPALAPIAPPLAEFWRLPEVMRRVGLGRSTIYRRVQEGEFPAPRDLGGGASAWWAEDVLTWMRNRPVADRGRAGYRGGSHVADAAAQPAQPEVP